MSSNSEMQFPPAEPGAFELLCLDLWREIWKAEGGAFQNGRTGQAQHGVDFYGQEGGSWVGVQCKQRSGRLGARLKVRELEAEIERALRFVPPLRRFIVATSCAADAKLLRWAREITEAHRARDLFEVDLYFWERIWHEIHERKELLDRVLPLYWPRTSRRREPLIAPACLPSASDQRFPVDWLRVPKVAASGLGSVTPAALALWEQKLAFLLAEEPKTVDPEQKFRLRLLISEAREKLRELGGKE